MGQYFGTDGIRGRAGSTLCPELLTRAAYGFATLLGPRRKRYAADGRPRVIVAWDSRLSSPMLKAAVLSGLNLGGCDAVELGVVPTPLVAFMVPKTGAAGGVMVTASHNPIADNGVKFFGPDGLKIGAAQERLIEGIIAADGHVRVEDRTVFGQVAREDAGPAYLAFSARAVRPAAAGGLRVVLDCAYGATAELAPRAFAQAGHRVVAVNARFDGSRVNVACGATDLSPVSREVRARRADLGLAFDGDGDRVLAVDETGAAVDGDKIVALFATRLRRYRQQGAVVMTHMSNLGVEEALCARGIKMVRVEVGDVNVLAAMRRRRLNLGGEQSGHIIMRDRLPAGDGILVGLQLAALLSSARRPLSELAAQFVAYPQCLTNLRVRDKLAWREDRHLAGTLRQIRARYGDARFYLRPSGTEDVVRVLTEARERELCERANAAACAALLARERKRG